MEEPDAAAVQLLSLAIPQNLTSKVFTMADGGDFLGFVNNVNMSSELMPPAFNTTGLAPAPTLTQASLTRAIILCVMGFISLVGNVATMLSIRKQNRHRHGHVYTLIYHLSIADLCVTFWCIIGEAMWSLTVEWVLGNVACKIFKMSQMFSLYLSTFIMVLIGVDRFISVKYPLKSMSKGLCIRLIALCWSLSAVLSLPQTVVFHVDIGPFQDPFYQCVTYGFYTEDWQEQLYAIFTLFCMFIIPLIVLIATYVLTVCTLHRNEEFVDQVGSCRTLIDPNRRKLIRRAKVKSLRISVAIVCTFLLCWIPYWIMCIFNIFFDHHALGGLELDDLRSAIFFFGMSNSLFNPLIYGIFHLYKPRRKELLRGTSSKKTLMTNVSLQRQRSATLHDSVIPLDCHSIIHENGKTHHHLHQPPKSKLAQWQNGSASITEGHTVM